MNAQFIETKQGEDVWLKLRLGVITASCAHDLLPSKTGKGFKQARQTYMDELIGEVCTGRGEEINAKALEWGKVNEIAAKAAYSFETGEIIKDGGFIYGMDKRVGASPDGIIAGKNKGLELKCPYATKNHIAFLREDFVPPEYISQVQWSMWVSGFDSWSFASFDPRMKTNMIKIVTFERDEKMMALFSEIVPEFIRDFDSALARLNTKWGQQWD
jgi:hypothetical protein